MVNKTTTEIAASTQTRSYFDVLMKKIIEDISKQFYKVNELFRKRISEYRRAKQVLEQIHKESAQKVIDINANITALEKELYEKEGYVRVCQMRLGSRAERPHSERCDDKVEATLLKEYRTLRDTVVNLSNMIAEVRVGSSLESILACQFYFHFLFQSQVAQRSLLKTQMLQEDELNRKTNMLKLYEVDCMTIRDAVDFQMF